MCREAQQAKDQGDEPLSSEDPFSKSTLRSLEELKQDFLQRLQEVEVSAEDSVRTWTEEVPAKVQTSLRADRRSKGVAALKSALPSLADLERDFQNRRAVRQLGAGPVPAVPPSLYPSAACAACGAEESWTKQAMQTGSLKKLVEGKGFGFIMPDGGSKDVFLHFSDLLNGSSEDMVVGMRVSFFGEIDSKSGKTRARNASIIGDVMEPIRCVDDVQTSLEESKAACFYSRRNLLSVFQSLRERGTVSAGRCLPIRTVRMPHCEMYSQRRGGRHAKEDPRLDDEDLIVEMEDRLSRESGADAKNVETFGECVGGWSFEEAVAANARLPHRTFASSDAAFDLIMPFGVQEESRLETPPLVMHAVRRSMYRAVALQLASKRKDPEQCLSPVPSSGSLEQCASTAASSGSTSPSGHAISAADRARWREIWGNATPCYQ